MDNRLGLLFGRRLSRLRAQDLPNVALAITTYLRKQVPVGVETVHVSGAEAIALTSNWFYVTVLREDWDKIEPYLRDDTFTPAIVALPYINQLFRPEYVLVPAKVVEDPLYKRVLDVLNPLFPAEYPTSDY